MVIPVSKMVRRATVVLAYCCATSILAIRAANQGCPAGKQGSSLQKRVAQAAKQGSTPFIFESGHRFDYPCPGRAANCNNPLPYYWQAFCSFQTGWEKTWTDFMICPKEKQASVAAYYTNKEVAGFKELVRFSPCDLWPLIRGRTLWVVGDSHSYDFFHAAACFQLDLWDYNFEGGWPIAKEADAFAAMERHVQHSKPPECIPLLEGTMVCHFRVNHGQVFMGHALPLLERMAKPSDIAIVNFAHWHGTCRSLLNGRHKHVPKARRMGASCMHAQHLHLQGN